VFFRHIFAVLALVSVVACEQIQMNGPVGLASITITELRTGDTILSAQSRDLDATIADPAVGEENYNGYSEPLKLFALGIALVKDKAKSEGVDFQDDGWYLISAEGGYDYDANADNVVDDSPTQVFGTVHALATGAQLEKGGYVVSAVTEAAWQYVKDYIDVLDDAALQAALDEVAQELVTDMNRDEVVNYDDLRTWSRMFHAANLLGDASTVASINNALSETDDGSVTQLSLSLFSAAAPVAAQEAIYADSISDIIVNAGCGPSCHYPRGIGATGSDNDLEPPEGFNFVELNTNNFRSLVQSPGKGVDYIVNKATGQVSHTGGKRLNPGSAEVQAFQDWLELL